MSGIDEQVLKFPMCRCGTTRFWDIRRKTVDGFDTVGWLDSESHRMKRATMKLTLVGYWDKKIKLIGLDSFFDSVSCFRCSDCEFSITSGYLFDRLKIYFRGLLNERYR